jgi:copper chaperone CopZ
MLQRGIPTSNPLTYSRLVAILCAERLNISLIVQPCQTNKNILERWIIPMKKTIKLIDLDCGHCADKIQNAVQKINGVTSVSVNFLGQKMVLEAPDDRFDAILNEAKALIKKIEPDVTVKA